MAICADVIFKKCILIKYSSLRIVVFFIPNTQICFIQRPDSSKSLSNDLSKMSRFGGLPACKVINDDRWSPLSSSSSLELDRLWATILPFLTTGTFFFLIILFLKFVNGELNILMAPLTEDDDSLKEPADDEECNALAASIDDSLKDVRVVSAVPVPLLLFAVFIFAYR